MLLKALPLDPTTPPSHRYGNKYLVVWKAMMQQAIKQSTKYFDTTSFFDDRNQILKNISGELISQLSDQHVQNVSVIMGNVQVSRGRGSATDINGSQSMEING